MSKQVAANLFGAVNIQAKGGYEADPEIIKAVFEHDDSITRCFCAGCGGVYEIDEEQTNEFLIFAASPKKASELTKDEYIEIEQCEMCGDDAQLDFKVELKRINVH